MATTRASTPVRRLSVHTIQSAYLLLPFRTFSHSPAGPQKAADVPALVASDYITKLGNASGPHNVSGFYKRAPKETGIPPAAVEPMPALAVAPTDRVKERDPSPTDIVKERDAISATASTTAELFFDELTRRPPSLKSNVLIGE